MTQVSLNDKKIQASMLEDISFINRVLYQEPELERIWNGERATDVFPKTSERTSLLKYGILVCHYRCAGKEIVLSEKAKEVLKRYQD